MKTLLLIITFVAAVAASYYGGVFLSSGRPIGAVILLVLALINIVNFRNLLDYK